MTPDQIKRIVTEEGSGLRIALVFIVAVLVLSVIGFLSFKYWNAAHKPRQRDVEVGATENYPTTDNKPTAAVKHPEQQPNIGAQNSPTRQNPGNAQAPEKADIAWNFETKEGRFAFLGIQSIPGVVSEPLVNCFQAHGKNNLDDPILHFSGFIRSDTTNETFPVFLARDNQLLRPEDTLGIPRKAEFNLSAKPFPSNHPEGYLGAGMNASAFLKQYPELTFVFEYDGKRYVKHFTKQDIWTDVENFRRQSLGYDKP